MGIEDAYTAFCLDEACALILEHLQNKEKPTFRSQMQYSSFSSFYSQYTNKEEV